MAIVLRQDESIDSALRRFKKETMKAGLIQELRKRECYVGPSEKRRVKSKNAQKRSAKKSKAKLY